MSQTYTLDKHYQDWKLLDVRSSFYNLPPYMINNIWDSVYFTTRFKISVVVEEFNEREAICRRLIFASLEIELKSLIDEYTKSQTRVQFVFDAINDKRNIMSSEMVERRSLFSEKLIFDRSIIEGHVQKKFAHKLSLLSMKFISDTNRQLLRELDVHKHVQVWTTHKKTLNDSCVIDDKFIIDQLKHLIYYEKREYQYLTTLGKLIDLEVWKTTLGIRGTMKSRTGELVNFSFHKRHGHQLRVQNTVRNVMTRTLRLAGWIE